MDEAARRALIEQGSEDAVTVNQRALVDKLLARYASEFTVFRELIQNADDANASCCQLKLESVGYSPSSPSPTPLPNLRAPLSKWIWRNDGWPFRDQDWARLRRIAEGNPDPDRIGAFGVGFYSLFSICDEPVVASGDELMGFFWKNGGDSLFTRRAKNPGSDEEKAPSGNGWTSFFMTLREPAPLPDSVLSLARFLATSLTFTSKVRTVELWLDGVRLCRVAKSLESTPRPMVMPAHLNAYSPEKMMRVERLEGQAMQIDVEALALVWEGERERIRAEKEQAARPSLTAALTKSGGLSSMLQSAFGRSSKASASTPAKSPASTGPSAAEDHAALTARLLTSHSATAHLQIATAHLAVSVDNAFKREIERSTKKPPPVRTAFHIVFANQQDYAASQAALAHSGEDVVGPALLFEGVMPKLDRMGHVFIGFRTHQTTGFAGHVAARFLPTVERESIDFVDRYCARWNMELLAVGGYVCRAVYEGEMEALRKAWVGGRGGEDDAQNQALLARALHTMRFFTMRDSSPSQRVSSTFLSTFFSSSRQALLTLASTQGIKTSSQVRLPNAVLLEFVKKLAIVPPGHIEEASDFFDQVRARGLVKDVTLEDVFGELASRALSVEEMVACLRWWINVSAHPGYDARLRARLIDSAVLTTSSGSVQPLAGVKHFLNPQRVPSDVPLPVSCLAYEVSKSFSGSELTGVYGWTELSLPAWLAHLATISSTEACKAEENVQLSPTFAERVLGIVSRSWGNLSASQQGEATTILQGLSCVPTRKGMLPPQQAYFSSVSLFEDLAIVALPTTPAIRGNLEKLLVALGVRRHVDLQLIFTRLVGGGDWSHVDLLTYLAANRESLSTVEVDRLRKTPIWPREGEATLPAKEGAANAKPKVVRHRAAQLYEPLEPLRALGLPLLDWTGSTTKPWRSGSDEAKFAFDLGLRRHPPLEEILALAARNDEVGAKALAYFFERGHYRDSYSLAKGRDHAFVPCEVGGETRKMKSTDVFTNREAGLMGFAVVASSLSPQDVAKLQLRADPPSELLVSRLVNDPPRSVEQARSVFEYLASVSSHFTSHDISVLRQAAFVPVLPSTTPSSAGKEQALSPAPRLVAPTSCYFGGNDTVEAFRSVFLYVPPSLGAKANAFLRLVGVSDEPSIEEVATRLVSDPARFYALSGSTEAYLGLLRQVATNWGRIRGPLRAKMKASAFLLGSKRVQNGASNGGGGGGGATKNLLEKEDEEDADDSGMLVHSLRRPAEIVIVDDANAGMIFGSSLFFAPHEDLLEQGLYAQLGSPRLSQLIEEKYQTAGAIQADTKRALEVKALVLERTPLFLFECRQSGNRGEIRRDAEWLKGALDVVEVGGEGLRLSRTLRFLGAMETDVQRCSAMARSEGRRLTLYVASNMHLDWFEVASSLNKFLLSRQRLQEVLLFMTLLSTSLRDLKRRGFHVDKILQQRKAERAEKERERMEEQRRAQMEALSRPSEKEVEEWKKQVLQMFPDAEPGAVEEALRRHKGLEGATNDMLTRGYVKKAKPGAGANAGAVEKYGNGGSGGSGEALGGEGNSPVLGGREPTMPGGFFSGFRQRFTRNASGPSSLASGTSSLIRGPQGHGGGVVPTDLDAGPSSGSASNPATQAEQPSSLSSIRRNVLGAVSASRPDSSTSMHSEQRHGVKEAESSYCDPTSGVAADLALAGEVAGMRVFLSPELDPAKALHENRAKLDELIRLVYRPVGAIYGLDPSSLQAFIDTRGPTIAFNRGGTIWLNYRFAAAWFWDEAGKLQVKDALISTFFTMAHELAHNKVTEHGSAHEFWSSALAEHFFLALAKYVEGVEG
ncbi:hypothetical protein BDZ90DRAFT_244782 [Jaminaea rosea]|uniref:Sacsin/Nov domain-containing protein n=1 Tax=Jaminaea rosea TaxID=1569628 RepID=A0A316UHZ8_9BASI|nr:hypothetical protein BDZ90DRAFT_244782 [Jaminaea rosea]PWN24508.1 hypothetical protein BDZ90DRAFT_244782 [Jaminaea rosea]